MIRSEALLINFTPGEKMRLKLLADEVGVSMADMVRFMVAERILDRKLTDHPTVIKSLKIDKANGNKN